MAELDDEVMTTIAREALGQWGLENVPFKLASRSENVVFRVAGDRRDHALRIHRHGYHTREELLCEPVWIRALEDAGIGVPAAIPTTSGKDYATVAVPGTGETREVGLIPWFDGTPLSQVIEAATSTETKLQCYRRLGELIAALNNQASTWSPPQGFTRHHFDLDGFVGETPFWGRFWEVEGLTSGQASILRDARAFMQETMSGLSRKPGPLRHHSCRRPCRQCPRA